MIAAHGGDIDIVEAVIIEVADGAAHSVHLNGQPGLASDVCEGSVVVVVIERGIGLMGLMVRPIHRVDEQNVLPSVVVVVEKARAAAHRLRQVLLSECAAVVLEGDAGLSGHVSELNRT